MKSKGTESDKGKGAKGSSSSKKAKKSSSSDGDISGKTRSSKSTTKSRGGSGGKTAATAEDQGGTGGKGNKKSQGKKLQSGSSKKGKGAPYAVDDDAEADEARDVPVAAQGGEFDVGRMGGGKDRYTGKRADVRAKFKKGVNAVRANNAVAAGKKKKVSASEAQGAAPRKGNKVPV
eukprot:COSAG02_NODE_1018_length_15181_cov_18.026389_12_plen_176_part_00